MAATTQDCESQCQSLVRTQGHQRGADKEPHEFLEERGVANWLRPQAGLALCSLLGQSRTGDLEAHACNFSPCPHGCFVEFLQPQCSPPSPYLLVTQPWARTRLKQAGAQGTKPKKA